MRLNLIDSDTVEGYKFITVDYESDKLFGTITVDDCNDTKVLQVSCVHTDCIKSYSPAFEMVCNTINSLVNGKTLDDAITAIKNFNRRSHLYA